MATAGIFLPAFVFVALSGPLVPRLRRSPRPRAVLDGVNVASLALMAVVTWQLGARGPGRCPDCPPGCLRRVRAGLASRRFGLVDRRGSGGRPGHHAGARRVNDAGGHLGTGSKTEESMRNWLDTSAPSSVVLIRVLVGGVFLAEGIQKFLYPAELGAGRFARIGIPFPEVTGPFVGGAEIVCGALIIAGLLTRLAALVMLINISVAIVSTKLPILLGQSIGPFSLAKLPRYGFWSAIHEARTDLSMSLGSLFLVLVGAGVLSMDRLLMRRHMPLSRGG